MVNVRLRKVVRFNKMKVVVVGFEVDLIYLYQYLGVSIDIFLEIVEGRYLFCVELVLVERFVVIVGSGVLECLDKVVIMFVLDIIVQ